MKSLNKYSAFFVLLMAVVIAMVSCDEAKNEVEKSIQDKFTEQIVGTWNVNTVEVDGVTLSDFNGFSLTLSDGSYTTTNGNGIWPAQGTWKYTDSGITSITRDDGIEIAIRLLVIDDALELTFTYSVADGRVLGINDNFTFILDRQ